MKVELSRRQLEAVITALECEIPTRKSAVYNDLGERIESKGDALDDEVPAMEEALYALNRKLGR
jgi:hypothetical protein